MRPAHWNFNGLEPVMASQIQQFRIKAETLNALLVKDNAAAFAAECLEATLRVHERKPQNDANDTIENNSGKFAKRRFVDFDQLSIHGARADGHVVLAERGEKFVRFLDWGGKIGVAEQHVFASGFHHAVTNAVTFAAVFAVFQYPKIRDAVAECCRNFGSAVRRAVIHHQDFAAALRSEVLVVDDGSTDRTAKVAATFSDRIANLRVLKNGENRGKGYSVRHGMVEARGENVLFSDADLSAPIEEADNLLSALGQYDVAIGSRAMNRKLIEVHESPFREFAGIIFNRIVRIVLWLPFVDTQCGFKAFRRERCRIIFDQQRIERFGFDPELLYLARHHGLKSIEIPVRWSHSPATKINMMRDSVLMFVDVFTIRWNAILGRYRRQK